MSNSESEMIQLRGLTLSVYRANGMSCTNGVSRDHDRLTVVGIYDPDTREVAPLPADCRVFPATDTAPAMVLMPSLLPQHDPTPHLVTLDIARGVRPAGMVGPMFGGNYAGVGDGRWGRLGKLFAAGRFGVVAVHDRMESKDDYLEMGR